VRRNKSLACVELAEVKIQTLSYQREASENLGGWRDGEVTKAMDPTIQTERAADQGRAKDSLAHSSDKILDSGGFLHMNISSSREKSPNNTFPYSTYRRGYSSLRAIESRTTASDIHTSLQFKKQKHFNYH
jgi:hypothetical protein